MSASLSFFSWSRQGLAQFIEPTDPLNSTLDRFVKLPVQLEVNNSKTADIEFTLYGPGEIIGFDHDQVIRTDPVDQTRDYIPNYFPTIEFARADLPWLFTPAQSDNASRLRPWIVLVVVQKQTGVVLEFRSKEQLPVLRIESPAILEQELPPLVDSWAWGHVQVMQSVQSETLAQIARSRPEQVSSRLVCPRRLKPNGDYIACLVPAFQAGVEAGLGLAQSSQKLNPAWDTNTQTSTTLPVYHHWEFSTGHQGDFESLARQLEPRQVPASVGFRTMDIGQAGSGLPLIPPSAPGRIVALEGALQAPQSVRAELNDAIKAQIEPAYRDLLDPVIPERSDSIDGPIVKMPLYARWYAAQTGLPEQLPRWYLQLNLDPRERVVAGYGTQVVQDQQESLMHSAWQQIDTKVIEANRLTARAQLAKSLAQHVVNRKISRLSGDLPMRFTSSVHARIVAESPTRTSVQARFNDSRVPTAALSGVFRRITRPGSVLAKRAGAFRRSPRTDILSQLNRGSISVAADRTVPNGTVTPEAVADNDSHPLLKGNGIFLESVKAQGSKPNFRIIDEREGPDVIDVKVRSVQRDSTRRTGPDSRDAALFREAAGEFQTGTQQAHELAQVKPRASLPLTRLQKWTLEQIGRANSITLMLQHRLVFAKPSRDRGRTADDRLDLIMDYPTFDYPMYEALRDLSQDLLVPGLEGIQPNTVTLLQTNPRFIESYMAGLNHEMGRELLWRGFPTDQLGSYFRQFWDISGRVPAPHTEEERERARDIPELHRWGHQQNLGENMKGGSVDTQLVLLLRGELLRRFPTAMVYMAKARFKSNKPGQLIREREVTHEERYPLFRGSLYPDITFLGFNLDESEARGDPNPANQQPGWFVVIQQLPGEPRFGLDVADFTESLEPLERWDDLSWRHLAENEALLDRLSHVDLSDPPAQSNQFSDNNEVSWARNSAHMAAITVQKPVRIAIHADTMLPAKDGA